MELLRECDRIYLQIILRQTVRFILYYGYYCDGGEVIDNVTDDGVIVYPKTHEKHYNESVAAGGEGHYPEDATGIKTPKLVAMEEIIGKSIEITEDRYYEFNVVSRFIGRILRLFASLM